MAPTLPAQVHAGQWNTVSITFRDPDGYSNLQYGHILINDQIGGSSSYLILYPDSGHIGVLNDAGTDWQTAAAGTAGHYPACGRCVADVAGASVSNAGTDSTFTFNLYLTRDFLTTPRSGNTYSFIYDDLNANPGWQGAHSSTTVRSATRLVVTSLE